MILSNEPCEQGALGNPVRFVMFLLSLSLSLSEVGRGQGECWSEREPVSRSKACLVIINSLACRLLISAVQIVCRCLVYWLLIGIFCCQYCNSKNTFRHRGSLKPNLAIYPYSLFSVSTVLLRGFFFVFLMTAFLRRATECESEEVVKYSVHSPSHVCSYVSCLSIDTDKEDTKNTRSLLLLQKGKEKEFPITFCAGFS